MADTARETDLYAPVKAFLEDQGYVVKAEIGAADVVGVRGAEPPVVVELKLGFSLALFHQCIARLKVSDEVYMAVARQPGKRFQKALKDNIAMARRLGLDQPGGPAIEAISAKGDMARFAFPRPLANKPGYDLSFSGLKTAVLRARDELVGVQGGLHASDQADLAASFQAAVRDSLVGKSARALEAYLALSPSQPTFCVAGGVAANMSIRAGLEAVSSDLGARFLAPPLSLCTDNAAMIAAAGIEQMAVRDPDGMDLSARPRMPLDTERAGMLGSGKKGAKA